MPPAVDFPPELDIPMLTGPLALGYLWGYGLYGILLVQMYIYHVCFSEKDNRRIQVYVWIVFFFETVFTIFTTLAAWNASSKAWGHFENLLLIDWPWYPLTPLNGTIAAMVQSFYIWRIWCLTRRAWFCAVLQLISILQLAAAFYVGIRIGIERGSKDALINQTPMVSTWLSSSAACDLLITITLLRILWKAKHDSDFQRTNHVVTKLIRFTIQTGLITSVVVLLELILWYTNRKYNFHFIPYLILSKVYSNTLMATLNSRAMMFGGDGSGVMSPTVSSFWEAPKKPSLRASLPYSRHRLSDNEVVHITRTTEVVSESHEMIVQDLHLHPYARDVDPLDDKSLKFEDCRIVLDKH